MKKTDVKLDELHFKCLTELPFILDVLASTGNRLAEIFNPLYKDLEETLNGKNILPKGWELLNKNCKINRFWPLYDYDYGANGIDSLDESFEIRNKFKITEKKRNKKSNRSFYILFGFFYTKKVEVELFNRNFPFIYFAIDNKDFERYKIRINDIKFYNERQKAILNSHPDIKIINVHTDNDKKDKYEYFELFLKEISNVDKINSTYDVFKKELVIPFLNSIAENKK